jgi:hypothetical protein
MKKDDEDNIRLDIILVECTRMRDDQWHRLMILHPTRTEVGRIADVSWYVASVIPNIHNNHVVGIHMEGQILWRVVLVTIGQLHE